jgi:O-antigen/teichoic acid export membrane protein
MLSALLRRRPVGEFARNAGTVMVGTLIAQILPLLFYPIFTRIFTPADFGTFATISMIATPLAILASGTYEQAFLILKSDRAAIDLFRFILLRSAAVLIPSALILLAARAPIATALADPALMVALLLAPLIGFGQVIYNCTAEWLVRRKAFGALTGNRIWQSAILSLAKLGFGLGGWIGGGLVLGEALGRLMYMMQSYGRLWRSPLANAPVSRQRMAALARRHRSFPRLMVPDQLINTFGGTIHVLVIGYAFGPTELGYVSLIFSALYLPVTIVSSSVKDVFRQRASVDYVRDGNCRPLYVRLLLPVTLVGLAGFGLLYLIVPWLFVFVFGADWAKAGEYARILVPMFFFNFVAMSLGGVLVIAQRMGVSLGWQVLNLVLSAIALVVGVTVYGDVISTLVLFTIVRSISYLHYMAISYKYAKRPEPA